MEDRISIVINDSELLPWFTAVNEEWIGDMFAMEDTDRELLDNAQALIVDRGGKILYALHPGMGVVGACALLKQSETSFELTKMGVLSKARGLGAGELLVKEAIRLAREMGIENLYLLTNHRCEAAIHLYRKHGFKDDAETMRKFGSRYDRCNVAMRYFE